MEVTDHREAEDKDNDHSEVEEVDAPSKALDRRFSRNQEEEISLMANNRAKEPGRRQRRRQHQRSPLQRRPLQHRQLLQSPLLHRQVRKSNAGIALALCFMNCLIAQHF